MLGRGLESLIPPQHQNEKPEKEVRIEMEKPISNQRDKSIEGPIFHIEVDKIDPNPFQPRRVFSDDELKELAVSITEFGIIQPLIVTKIDKVTDTGREVRYQLVAGERRLRASKLAGLERVPVIVRSLSNDQEKLEWAILENLQRSDLNPIETARAYAKLQDQFGLTQREVAVRLGKSRESVANTIRLLSLPTYIQDSVSKGQISESQGRLLLAVSDAREQQALFTDLVNNNLSVRELKQRVERKLGVGSRSGKMVTQIDSELTYVGEKLEQFLGTKVRLERKGGGGKITIDFYSPEELQTLVDKFFGSETSSVPRDADGAGHMSEEEFHV